MKIAIHNGSGFNKHWINYCKIENIPYKVVNCFDNDIIHQVQDCDALMWHHHHNTLRPDHLIAKQLLYALEQSGKKVFPNFKTSWHFDDKLGQKYLFESIGAALVPTYAYFSKESALEWINQTSFPKVFKLRNGASSWNVKLIKSKNEALKITDIAFGIGFSHEPTPFENFKEIWRKYKKGKVKFDSVKGAIKKLILPKSKETGIHREMGYVYFQEFIPNNHYDIRIVIINNKGYGFRRKVRENDFRASGSGEFDFKKDSFPIECIKIGFDIASKYGLQSAAFDFVIDTSGNPLIVEVSYGFASTGNYKNCEGFWDKELNWYPGPFNPYGWMVETLLNS